ncbi:MAG: hypothetical protein V1883_00675 [Candidatus Omnitrophota bacterium]
MPPKNQKNNNEKRKYIRLDSVFPIEFQVVGGDRRELLSEMKEGFTRNIGKGGMGIFAKTLKEHDKEVFSFVPHETKLRLIINIPLDSEPIECFATVEWVEKEPGHIVDTYAFGVSYDFINEIEYERIVDYIRWLHLKPRLSMLAVVILGVFLTLTIAGLLQINVRRMEKEKELLVYSAENKRAEAATAEAEKNRIRAESELMDVQNKQSEIEERIKKTEEEKTALERKARLSEEDRATLQAAFEEVTEDKAALEKSAEENEESAIVPVEVESEPPDAGGISAQRIKLEEGVYKRFNELILDGKIHPLSAYVSAHRGSIYHAAALFALAELRYKAGDASLAEANYAQIVELYPRSKYARYASHRLDQIRQKHNYVRYSLKDLCEKYNLPELFDYRSIEPYHASQ